MSTGVLPNQQCIFGAERCAHGQVIVDKERPDRPVVCGSRFSHTFGAGCVVIDGINFLMHCLMLIV